MIRHLVPKVRLRAGAGGGSARWPRRIPRLALALSLLIPAAVEAGQNLGDLGSFAKWSKVEIDLQGPNSNGLSTTANPFAIDVDVTFSGPGGASFTVPAFYDGNGSGGMNGNVWRVRFSPSVEGSWSFASTSPDPLLDGNTGSFTVTAVPPTASSFARWGRLEYVGEHYLKFADGGYWIKGGADDPEDFLGPGVMGNWNGKKSAVDYLASKGVNSMYIMLHNVQGDGNNVWPWASASDSDHFDVAKLADWEDLFAYIQAQGIVLHLVFEDDSAWTGFNRPLYYREMIARFAHHNGLYWNISEEYNENYTAAQVQGFAQQIRDLDPYDHPLTVHNQGGLSSYSAFLGDPRFDLTSFQTAKAPQNSVIVDWRAQSAAAGRPWAVSLDESGKIGEGDRELGRKIAWSVFLGGGMFELHTSPLVAYQDFDDHWDDLRNARTFVESFPFWEMAPANGLLVGGSGNRYCLAKPGEAYLIYLEGGGSISLDLSGVSGAFDVRWYDPRTAAYTAGGNVSGGGVVALGSAPFGGDAALSVALPSGNQDPVAVISAPGDGQAFPPATPIAFSSAGSFDPDGTLSAFDWTFGDGGTSGAEDPTHSYSAAGTYTVTLEVEDNEGGRSPPDSIELVITSANVPPSAADQNVTTAQTAPVGIFLSFTDPDGPGPYDYSIVSSPTGGQLTGVAPALTYTSNPGFLGVDSFTWSVNDGIDESNVATVSISVVDNVAPTALDFALGTAVDTPVDFSFGGYVTDPDGPGPYTYTIILPPTNGTVTGVGNDRTYTPAAGYVGPDSFKWKVHDGIMASAAALVTVTVNELVFADDFDRLDSMVVGNGWVEVESLSQAQIAASTLSFDAVDEANLPLVRRSFAQRTGGVLDWSFDFDFSRQGSENTYAFWMQLGEGAAMSDANPEESGVAVNLKWGGPSEGLATHEGFGYVVDGTVTQVAAISGLQQVAVTVDLEAQTYSLSVAGQQATGIPFESPVPIDTVRLFVDLLNQANFQPRSIDNIEIRGSLPCNATESLFLANQTISSDTLFEACTTISAGDDFKIVAPAVVTFRARTRIELRNGFTVAPGAEFSASIDPTTGAD